MHAYVHSKDALSSSATLVTLRRPAVDGKAALGLGLCSPLTKESNYPLRYEEALANDSSRIAGNAG